MAIDFKEIVRDASERKASDIHIVPTMPPCMRIDDNMYSMGDYGVLTAEDTKELIFSILSEEQKENLKTRREIDFSWNVPDVCRLRVNVLMQKDGMGAVLRLIPSVIPSQTVLRIPDTITSLANLSKGLVLVTGPTGSGKSTTLASLLDIINATWQGHIITLEDPIEFVYKHKQCIVTQRELGVHVKSFEDGLKYALRQDPDVVLLGEMRDTETIGAGITIAETGHLVFATLHTNDAPQTIDRIIDAFPPHRQQQIRIQLSVALKAVIAQQLIPKKDGKGRVAAYEIMLMTPAVANLIREGKTHQLYSSIDLGSKEGMISMDKSLAQLVKDGLISKEEAISRASSPAMLQDRIARGM